MRVSLKLLGLSCLAIVAMGTSIKGLSQTASSVVVARAQAAVGKSKLMSLVLRGGAVGEFDGRTGLVVPTPDPIEIRLLFTNGYLRSVRAGVGLLREEGFVDATTLHSVVALSPDMNVSPSQVGNAYLPSQQAVAARLMLGIAGILEGPLMLTADPPLAGSPNSAHITGGNNQDWILEVEPGSGLPLRIKYSGTAFFYTPPASGQQDASRQVDKADFTLIFSDRRAINGFLIPHVITKNARSQVTGKSYDQEVIRIDHVLVNTLSKADFKNQK